MPGRIGSPMFSISGYRASSPLTSVPAALPAPGCIDEAGGLRDHDDLGVGEPHVDGHLRVGRGPNIGFERRLGEHLEHVSLVQAMTLRDGLPVDQHGAVVDE